MFTDRLKKQVFSEIRPFDPVGKRGSLYALLSLGVLLLFEGPTLLSGQETRSVDSLGTGRHALSMETRAESSQQPAPLFTAERGTIRGQDGSLLDNISFIFKKEKEEEKNLPAKGITDEKSAAYRRPMTESLEATGETPTGGMKVAQNTSSEEGDHSPLLLENESDPPALLDASDTTATPESILQHADAAYEREDWLTAESDYKHLLDQTETGSIDAKIMIRAYHQLGRIAWMNGDLQTAQTYLIQAIKNEKEKNPEITLEYAQILCEAEEFRRAKPILEYLVKKFPEMEGSRYSYGIALLNLKEGESALEYLEERLGRADACRLVAQKSRELGDEEVAQKMEKALDAMGESYEIDPKRDFSIPVVVRKIKTSDGEEGDDSSFLLEDASSIRPSGAQLTDDPTSLPIDSDQTTRVNSPLIHLETLGPKRIMVGQESEYKIFVENKSNQTARSLVVQTEIPEGIEITGVAPTAGTSRITEKEVQGTGLVCLWNLGDFDPKRSETLTFKFISRVRNNIDLTTSYDYDKSILTSGITVTEPVLELAIEGEDSINWGARQKYRMKLRNSGDGEARNIRLTIATGDSDNATRILKSIAPGEEKTMDINLKTVLDGTLTVQATAEADYGISATAEKEIDILRGRLDLFVEVPEVQFVNDETDYLVHVCNTGRASLQNVDVIAAIPATIEVISASDNATQNNATRQLIWKIPSIKPEEEVVFQVKAKTLRAGMSRINVTAADKTGVSTNSEAPLQIEAIAALEMKINKPTGAVAIGKEIDYEVVITNNGTKAAEEIDAGLFLPPEMTPISVSGGGMVIPEESKVLFNKISFLGPGQTIAYKVTALAKSRGNHKVQAVLESKEDNIQLVREEMNFFYDKRPAMAKKDSEMENDEMTLGKVAMNPQGTTRTVPSDSVTRPAESGTADSTIPEFPMDDPLQLMTPEPSPVTETVPETNAKKVLRPTSGNPQLVMPEKLPGPVNSPEKVF